MSSVLKSFHFAFINKPKIDKQNKKKNGWLPFYLGGSIHISSYGKNEGYSLHLLHCVLFIYGLINALPSLISSVPANLEFSPIVDCP